MADPDPERNYVDGAWRTSDGGTFATRSPVDPDEVVAEYQESTAADVDDAVAAAADAAGDWAQTPGPERGRYLREAAKSLDDRREALADALSHEEGKTLAEARPEVGRAVDIFYYYAETAADYGGRRKQSGRDGLYTVREPQGVAGLITPWNYPIAIPAWKLAPALATGNAAVVKPANLAPGPAVELVRALDAAGIPDGVVNLVTGPGSVVGARLSEHPDVDAVSFTGSTAVGLGVYADATDDRKRVQTEMGGKNPCLVTANADPERAAGIVAAGAFGVTGQACTATSRAIVHEDVYEEFCDAVVAEAASLTVGDGRAGADVGPQVSERELEGTLEYVRVADEDDGATLLTGGSAADVDGHDGYFVEPTVFADVEPSMTIACEEVFGPVLAVIPVGSFAEGVAVANDTAYGLSASVVTDDLAEAHRFVRDVEAGVAKVNEKTTGLELHVPFGGVKESSANTYREQGDAAVDFFTRGKTVYMNVE
jgi:aldehyde dehydrogenase (NAD+)